MFTLLTAFIATFVALCKGLMLLIGALLGGAAFLFLLGALLVAGVNALIQAWYARDTVGARA
ncbi:hypothetical protein [Thiomonas sp.]|jgi:membrane protein implicated in regulation of membrane protease activity|uniref:hypothetical protein n=1 Tax=Thiomonas sp. TaxID=2047785 RepID=UPI000BD34A03|nr:hypothetical protein [Thiomonas sp.]OZB55290.1 MAG: hypothetical protein B7X43_01315 [Thiomonas sp. 15-63-373]